MEAVVRDARKPRVAKLKVRRIGNGFKSLMKKVYGWSLIDGDVFLESKDWPYLWKK